MNHITAVSFQKSVNCHESYQGISNFIDVEVLRVENCFKNCKETCNKQSEYDKLFQQKLIEYQSARDALIKQVKELKEKNVKLKEEDEILTIQEMKLWKANQRLVAKKEKFKINKRIAPSDVERMSNWVKTFEFLQQFSNISFDLSVPENIITGYTHSEGGYMKYFEVSTEVPGKDNIINKLWQQVGYSSSSSKVS